MPMTSRREPSKSPLTPAPLSAHNATHNAMLHKSAQKSMRTKQPKQTPAPGTSFQSHLDQLSTAQHEARKKTMSLKALPPKEAHLLAAHSAQILKSRLEAEVEKRQQAIGLQAACDEMEACVFESRRALEAAMAQRREAPERITMAQIEELENELRSAEAEASCARDNAAHYQALDRRAIDSVKKYLTQQEVMPQQELPRPLLQTVQRTASHAHQPAAPTNRKTKQVQERASTCRRASTGRKLACHTKDFETRKHTEASAAFKREKLRKAAERSRQKILLNMMPPAGHPAPGLVAV